MFVGKVGIISNFRMIPLYSISLLKKMCSNNWPKATYGEITWSLFEPYQNNFQ